MIGDEEMNRRLAIWAQADPAGAGGNGAVQRMAEHGRIVASADPVRPLSHRWKHMAGAGAIAVSLLVAFIGVNLAQQHGRQPTAVVSSALPASTADNNAALTSFALLHVPTDEEEEILI